MKFAPFITPTPALMTSIGATSSMTRLGDFYKFLATNCLTKVAKIYWCLFGLFLIMSLLCKLCGYYLGYIQGGIRQFLFHHLVTLVTNAQRSSPQPTACTSLLDPRWGVTPSNLYIYGMWSWSSREAYLLQV